MMSKEKREGGKRGVVTVLFVCQKYGTLYLLIVRQKFAELRELLCSVTVSSAVPDILNYLLSRPAER